LAEKRTIALQETVEQLDLADGDDGRCGVCHLLAAECHYQLDQFDEVVHRLEQAVASGVEEPLVHFALGHNMLTQAERRYTATDEDSDEIIVLDGSAYRSALLKVVSAFERGLTGGPMDADLHWWIGTCLERAGFDSAAAHAFSQAKGVVADADSAQMSAGEDPVPEPEYQGLTGTSLSEVQRVRELLKRSYTVADILGDTEM